MDKKKKASSLCPILLASLLLKTEEDLLTSDVVTTLKAQHNQHEEGVTNLCSNIFRQRHILVNIKTDTQLYHRVYTDSTLYTGAEHVLGAIALVYCSSPPESVVESMGSIIEKIKDIRGSSKTSTRKQDVDDISQELVVHWNGPVLSQCESLVKQALNLHFKGGSWHFAATDVRSKLHKVSKVIDRLNHEKSALSFM